MRDLIVSPFPLGEQAEESRAREVAGGPGIGAAAAGPLCPLPKGDIGRVPVWSTVETLAKCYYPELAHLRDGNGLLADYSFPKGACPGESPPHPNAQQIGITLLIHAHLKNDRIFQIGGACPGESPPQQQMAYHLLSDTQPWKKKDKTVHLKHIMFHALIKI